MTKQRAGWEINTAAAAVLSIIAGSSAAAETDGGLSNSVAQNPSPSLSSAVTRRLFTYPLLADDSFVNWHPPGGGTPVPNWRESTPEPAPRETDLIISFQKLLSEALSLTLIGR
jgi:hypothetical protein